MGKAFSRSFKFVVLGTIIGWVSPASGHSVRADEHPTEANR